MTTDATRLTDEQINDIQRGLIAEINGRYPIDDIYRRRFIADTEKLCAQAKLTNAPRAEPVGMPAAPDDPYPGYSWPSECGVWMDYADTLRTYATEEIAKLRADAERWRKLISVWPEWEAAIDNAIKKKATSESAK
jgi:hypothetical protein